MKKMELIKLNLEVTTLHKEEMLKVLDEIKAVIDIFGPNFFAKNSDLGNFEGKFTSKIK